jgi:hypothetical protein
MLFIFISKETTITTEATETAAIMAAIAAVYLVSVAVK